MLDVPSIRVAITRPGVLPRPDAVGLTVAPSQPLPTVLRVRCRGELDLATAPRLEAVLRQSVLVARSARSTAPDPEAPARVICDLGAVTFLGASGLRVLVDTHLKASARDVEFVVEVGPVARRAVELLALQRLLVLQPCDRTTGTDHHDG